MNYIVCFIAQLTTTCNPLFKLLKKDMKIELIDKCQAAFDKIKKYLLNPLFRFPPDTGISIDSLSNGARGIHGLHVRPAE